MSNNFTLELGDVLNIQHTDHAEHTYIITYIDETLAILHNILDLSPYHISISNSSLADETISKISLIFNEFNVFILNYLCPINRFQHKISDKYENILSYLFIIDNNTLLFSTFYFITVTFTFMILITIPSFISLLSVYRMCTICIFLTIK